MISGSKWLKDRSIGWVPVALAFLVAILATGCGTVPNSYIPSTVGPMENAKPTGPIEVLISTSQDSACVGDNLYFTVVIRNRGPEAVWIPRDPDVLLTWIYPNGQRDSFMREFSQEQHFSETDAVLLRPGQQMTRSVVVKTYYFPRPGITEFRALVHASRNTNSRLQPFWNGRSESNSYGVMVGNPKKKSARGEFMSRTPTELTPSS